MIKEETQARKGQVWINKRSKNEWYVEYISDYEVAIVINNARTQTNARRRRVLLDSFLKNYIKK